MKVLQEILTSTSFKRNVQKLHLISIKKFLYALKCLAILLLPNHLHKTHRGCIPHDTIPMSPIQPLPSTI